jgi:phosphohistidine phosphatase
MRHAKAEPFAPTDHARVLTERGRADAADAGRHLKESAVVPDYAVVSSAERTKMTWAEVARACGSTARTVVDKGVYAGGPDVVLETLRVVPADTGTLIFIGHNPTSAYLCHLLDDGEGAPEAISGMLRGFPTSALVVFEITVPWEELGPETGRVVDFFAPSR